MNNNPIDRLEPFVFNRLTRWHQLFQELIRSGGVFEDEFQVVKAVCQFLDSLGVNYNLLEHDAQRLKALRPAAWPPFSSLKGRYSIAIRLPGKGGGRSLILNSHLDVIPPGDLLAWSHPPFEGYIDKKQHIIYGRGAMDDKAGVVISLACLEILLKFPLHLDGEVVFHFVLEDETTGNGSLLCLDAGYKADCALIIDGTRKDKAIYQHAGNLQFEIHLRGKPASVSVSHVGVNAAEMLARLIIGLRDMVFSLNVNRTDTWTRFPSPYQMVIQRFHSDGEQLTVPTFASAQCYVTFPPPFTLEKMCRLIDEYVKGFACEHKLPDRPDLIWNGMTLEPVCSDVSEIAPYLQSQAVRLGMQDIDFVPSTGNSDLRHFVKANIPCLLYGPGDGYNPHRPDEHYYLEDLPKMILFYCGFIFDWCNNSNTDI